MHVGSANGPQKKAPNVVKLLAHFCPSASFKPFHSLADAEAGPALPCADRGADRFRFTSVTINKNYAASAHRDANHDQGGRARIVALGSFERGGLWVQEDGAGGAVGADGDGGDIRSKGPQERAVDVKEVCFCWALHT